VNFDDVTLTGGRPGLPTAVVLRSFAATRTPLGVQLRWRTASVFDELAGRVGRDGRLVTARLFAGVARS
jgi:hypothetical protein